MIFHKKLKKLKTFQTAALLKSYTRTYYDDPKYYFLLSKNKK